MEILGIDIGGSGIKAAIVDTQTGDWLTERFRIDTPDPARHECILQTLEQIADHFQWKGPVGCGFPGVIHEQTIRTAANLHKSLVGEKLGEQCARFFGEPAWLVNDADAAGVAEVHFGLGDRPGVVLFLTVGTGIGTAMFVDGKLSPNTELGHTYMRHGNKDKFSEAEHYCADSARKRKELSWEEWAHRFNGFLATIHALIQPDEIIVGGGVARKGDKFMEYLQPPCPIRLAKLQNRAGITGAALVAEKYVS